MEFGFSENFCAAEVFAQIYGLLNQMRFRAERLMDSVIKNFGLKTVPEVSKKLQKIPLNLDNNS